MPCDYWQSGRLGLARGWGIFLRPLTWELAEESKVLTMDGKKESGPSHCPGSHPRLSTWSLEKGLWVRPSSWDNSPGSGFELGLCKTQCCSEGGHTPRFS